MTDTPRPDEGTSSRADSVDLEHENALRPNRRASGEAASRILFGDDITPEDLRSFVRNAEEGRSASSQFQPPRQGESQPRSAIGQQEEGRDQTQCTPDCLPGCPFSRQPSSNSSEQGSQNGDRSQENQAQGSANEQAQQPPRSYVAGFIPPNPEISNGFSLRGTFVGKDGTLYVDTVDGFTTVLPLSICARCGVYGHSVLGCRLNEGQFAWVTNGLHRPRDITTIISEYQLQLWRHGYEITRRPRTNEH